MRHVHERLRLGVDERGPAPSDPLAQAVGKPVGGSIRGEDQDEQPRPAPEQSEHRSRGDEDEPGRPDPGKADEKPVEPADAVVDDPALQMPVGRDQVGSSCLVWSISSCGLKGFPTKA